MSEEDLVIIEEGEGYATLRINRPAKRNAMNKAARTAMLAALESVRGRFSAVIITGTESSFCSGMDLKEASADREAGIESDPATSWQAVNLAIRAHPAIFIAAVNGIALGGGVTLINMCDLAVASEDAQLGMPEMGFATYPGLAGPSTQYSLGRKRTAWMMFTTNRIDGATAERWGLGFEPAALSISKSALDRIPNHIDWNGAFQFGVDMNREIAKVTTAASEGLLRFSKGERLIGQG